MLYQYPPFYLRLTCQLTARFIFSSPALSSDGILYFVSGGKLSALTSNSSELAVSPWPMFRHDLKHTGGVQAAIPGNVSATVDDSQVAISWAQGSGALSYNIYWSNSPGITTFDNKIASVTSPYSHTGLTNGVTYYYAVTAENSCGESSLSAEVSVTVGAPDAPTNVQAVAGNGQVSLSWNASDGATSYTVYRNETGGLTMADTLVYNGSDTQYVDTGLAVVNTYYYAVIASNTYGDSDLSNEVSATTVMPGFYSVIIDPGDGTLVDLCPDYTTFTANVTGGIPPYSYSWTVVTTAGFDFVIDGPQNARTLKVCAPDSMSEGTIEVIVTDSNSDEATDSIDIGW